jgi:hypothetical protein
VKTGVVLFASSAAFGAISGLIYAFYSHDIAGTMLLGMMTLALLVITLYIRIAERDANLRADDDGASPKDGAGDVVGTFALQSYWPALAALSVALGMIGLVFLPGLSEAALLLGGVMGVLVIRLLVREST